MRTLTTLLLLASLVVTAAFAPAGLAQSRARRVGQSQPTATTPAPQPRTPSAQTPGTADGARDRQVQEEVGDDEVVRVESTLVTIPVSVLDRDGRFIPALGKDDFRIIEDGVEQQVAYFATVESPFTVALVLDTSGSTQFRLEDIQSAATAFVDQLRPDDRVLVVSFDDEIRFLSEATSDRRQLRDAIRRTRPGGGTRLYDAFDAVIKQRLASVEGRKAIVLFTDGVDTSSKRASYSGNMRDAEELDALVYPVQYDTYGSQQSGGGGWPGGGGGGGGSIPRTGGVGDILIGILGGIGSRRGGGGPVTIGGGGGATREDYARAGRYLRELATLTGGRHYQADDLSYLRQAFSNIAEELRRQYSLGYYPSKQAQASERRQIKVRVKRPNLVVRARDSYIYRPGGSTTTAQGDPNRQPSQTPPELRRKQFAKADAPIR
ncbi:MAG TPA: VWA domain-containing protein [Pyrinomonadaceae bacterium]